MNIVLLDDAEKCIVPVAVTQIAEKTALVIIFKSDPLLMGMHFFEILGS